MRNVQTFLARAVEVELLRQDRTKQALADALQMDRWALSRRLHGRSSITVVEMERIATFLGMDTVQLLTSAAEEYRRAQPTPAA